VYVCSEEFIMRGGQEIIRKRRRYCYLLPATSYLQLFSLPSSFFPILPPSFPFPFLFSPFLLQRLTTCYLLLEIRNKTCVYYFTGIYYERRPRNNQKKKKVLLLVTYNLLPATSYLQLDTFYFLLASASRGGGGGYFK
jgi:hypothetical protein